MYFEKFERKIAHQAKTLQQFIWLATFILGRQMVTFTCLEGPSIIETTWDGSVGGLLGALSQYKSF